MSTDTNGATLSQTVAVKDCPGANEGMKYSHVWIAKPNSPIWPHQQQCIRCGGIREIAGSQK